jgi:hypothetical protein
MPTTFYSGPGKSYFNSLGFQADGENGQINAVLDHKTTQRGTAMFGRIRETVDEVIGKVSLTPFDNWGLLRTMFPQFLGVTTGANTGALVIGARPHDNMRVTGAGSSVAQVPLSIWTPDGRIYQFVRAAITKHPELKLGTGQPLFGQIEFTCLGDLTKNVGDSGYLITGSAITESGGSDPGSAFAMSDFINGQWTGAWGTGAGFGGDGGAALQAEEFFTLVPEVKYDPLAVMKVTRQMKLASVNFMVKCRPVGPTHTQIAAAILGQASGYSMATTNGADLVLTGPSSKTITLKNCEIKGAGFEFGGNKLGTGEIGFVTSVTFTTGAAQPSLVFSA